MKFNRILNLPNLLEKKSFFLLGPRSTGKSTLIDDQLVGAKKYDLLSANVYRDLLRRPSLIEEQQIDSSQIIVIDEIQKLPELLDEVHRLIQKRNFRFLLTGSSARKLKRGGANLLAGRAWTSHMLPLCSPEIPNFSLDQYLNRGGLPQVYQSNFFREELKEYVSTYVKEEIQAEAITRNTSAFSEFLDILALSNGQEINYENLASDCQVSPLTIKNYIQIIADTLIGFTIPAFIKTKKRKAITRGKHYLFDIGVTNTLCNRSEILPKSELFGFAFEHFILLEIRAYLTYTRSLQQINYWRSTSQFEVDFIIGNELAIEVKSSDLITERHTKGLLALKEEGIVKKYIVVSNDPEKRTLKNGIEIYPYELFLKELWDHKLLR
jgi:predicted AAA+ superfamily ATPase